MKMRRVYISVSLLFAVSVAFFLASFAYLDRLKHRTYLYDVALEGRLVGAIRIDIFITDEKRIYKSEASFPFYPLFTEFRSRIDLDRRYLLEDYSREKCAESACDLTRLENRKGLVSFVSRYGSYFACVDNIPVRKETYIFEEDSPVTYLPVLENYDFSKGRSQGFNALTCPASPELPPMKRFVTLTSIRDEYLKIDSRKIKAENLILKMRNYPQGSIWVAKSDHALLKIELPDRGLVITRAFTQKTLTPKTVAYGPSGYVTKDISIKSKGAELKAALTIPDGEGRHPAVLLLTGSGPFDHTYLGIYSRLTDRLARSGYCVLSFDNRSAGGKKDPMALSRDEERLDALAALEYLGSFDRADPGRIALLGHGAGARLALAVSSGTPEVRALVLMAPTLRGNPLSSEGVKEIGRRAAASQWSDDYLSLIVRTAQETQKRSQEAGGAWISILGKRCYAADVLDDPASHLAETAPAIKAPVLIMQGRRDTEASVESAAVLDSAIVRSGNQDRTLTYYAYLGHYLGNRVNNGINRIYYELDEDVVANILDWLGKRLEPRREPPAAAQTGAAAQRR